MLYEQHLDVYCALSDLSVHGRRYSEDSQAPLVGDVLECFQDLELVVTEVDEIDGRPGIRFRPVEVVNETDLREVIDKMEAHTLADEHSWGFEPLPCLSC